MITELLARPRLRSHWAVAVDSRGSSFGHSQPVADGEAQDVVVGDACQGQPSVTWSKLTARLHWSGAAAFVADAAPPALWITQWRVGLLPQTTPTTREHLLGDGDRLLMPSAAALEGDPSALVTLLQQDPAYVLGTPAEELIRKLLDGRSNGAVAVASHHTTYGA